MDKNTFTPEGVTGAGEPTDMFYRSDVTGPQGAHYELLREAHHSEIDVKRAKAYLKNNFDTVSIKIIKEKEILIIM
jgi:hypothetical protein